MNCFQDYLLWEVWIQQGEQSELDAQAFAAFEVKLKKNLKKLNLGCEDCL